MERVTPVQSTRPKRKMAAKQTSHIKITCKGMSSKCSIELHTISINKTKNILSDNIVFAREIFFFRHKFIYLYTFGYNLNHLTFLTCLFVCSRFPRIFVTLVAWLHLVRANLLLVDFAEEHLWAG